MNVFSFFGEKRIVDTNKEDLIKILIHNDPDNPIPTIELHEETQKEIGKMGIIVVLTKCRSIFE